MEAMLKFEGTVQRESHQVKGPHLFTGFPLGDKQEKETSGTCQSTSPGPNGSGFRDRHLLQTLVMKLIVPVFPFCL